MAYLVVIRYKHLPIVCGHLLPVALWMLTPLSMPWTGTRSCRCVKSMRIKLGPVALHILQEAAAFIKPVQMFKSQIQTPPSLPWLILSTADQEQDWQPQGNLASRPTSEKTTIGIRSLARKACSGPTRPPGFPPQRPAVGQ